MTSKRPTCVWCGKPYGERVTTEHLAYFCEGQRVPDPPPSNLELVRREIIEYGVTGGGRDRFRVRFILWDGVSFRTPYEPFCTMRCGLYYAQHHYKTGR